MNEDWTRELRENNDYNLLENNIKLDELDIKKFQKLALHIYNVKNIFRVKVWKFLDTKVWCLCVHFKNN